jgi:hypothetical protein
MITPKEPLSKEEGKYIKRKIDRLLKEFSNMSRAQLASKLSLIARHVGRSD